MTTIGWAVLLTAAALGVVLVLAHAVWLVLRLVAGLW